MKHIILFILLVSYFNAFHYAQTQSILEELSQKSDLIITGNVTKVISRWDANKARIWTYITIVPTEYLKGTKSTNEITIKIIGGKVGDITMDVSGVPKFNSNEQTFLFLKKRPDGNYTVFDWHNGKYTLTNDYWMNKETRFPKMFFIQRIKSLNKSK